MKEAEACCIPIVVILGGLLYDGALQTTGLIKMAKAFLQLKVKLIFQPKINAPEAVGLMIALADIIEQTQKDVPVLIYYYGHGNGISINLSQDESVEIKDILCPLGASEHLKKVDKTILLECCRVCDDGTVLNYLSNEGLCNYLGSVLLAYATLHGKPAEGPIWGRTLARYFSEPLPVIQVVHKANKDVKQKTEQTSILCCTTGGSVFFLPSGELIPIIELVDSILCRDSTDP